MGADVEAISAGPPGVRDPAVLAMASAAYRILAMLDKDFGELAVLRGQKHHGIIRLVDVPALQHGQVILGMAERFERELAAGAIVTVQPGRVRVRPGGPT